MFIKISFKFKNVRKVEEKSGNRMNNPLVNILSTEAIILRGISVKRCNLADA
jgi:hypothetical protein